MKKRMHIYNTIFALLIIFIVSISCLQASTGYGKNKTEKNNLTNKSSKLQEKYSWRATEIFWSDLTNYENYLVMIDVFRGMIIINGTNSQEMQIISETKNEYLGDFTSGAITIYQHYIIYAPEREDFILIFDISDPAEPALVSQKSLNIGQLFNSKLYTVNDKLVVQTRDIFYFFSLLTITNPVFLGSFETDVGDSDANKIVFKDDLLFIDEEDYFSDTIQLSIYNISDLENILLIGNYSSLPSSVSNISVNGSNIFVSLFEEGLYVFNYSLVDDPVLLYNFTGSYSQESVIYDAQIIDDYLYVLKKDNGLMLFSSENYTYLVSQGNYSIAWEYSRLFYSDSHIFLLEGLGNIDVYSLAGAPILQFVNSIDFGAVDYVDISFQGNLGFISCNRDGLYIVDFSDLADPIKKAKIRRKAIFKKSIADNNNLFILDYLGNILVYDITNPSEPIFSNNYFLDQPQKLNDMLLINDILFVSSWKSGLFSLDVSDPTDITLIDQFTGFGNVSDIELFDQVLFALVDNATTGVSGLGFINVTNPGVIEPINKIELTNDLLTCLTIDNFVANIGVVNNSVFRVDVHNLANPTIENYSVTKMPIDLIVYGNYLYAASIGYSILVYDVSHNYNTVAYFHEGGFGQYLGIFNNYIVQGEFYSGTYFIEPFTPLTKGFGYRTISYILGLPSLIMLLVFLKRKKEK